jgi:hypothetical protein
MISFQVRLLQIVIPGLDPGTHVDGRVKPGHDEQGRRFDLKNCALGLLQPDFRACCPFTPEQILAEDFLPEG